MHFHACYLHSKLHFGYLTPPVTLVVVKSPVVVHETRTTSSMVQLAMVLLSGCSNGSDNDYLGSNML